jgi:hypothetical protein
MMGNGKDAYFQPKKPLFKCEYDSEVLLIASSRKNFHAFHKVQDWSVKVITNTDANFLPIEVCHFSWLQQWQNAINTYTLQSQL